MPTEMFTSGNSRSVYTVPDGVQVIRVTLNGAGGGAGEDGGGDFPSSGGDGGVGGSASGELSVTPGETLTVDVAGRPGSPFASGGAGGSGGEVGNAFGGDGGDGAGATAITRDADGTIIAVAEGGGGGAGGGQNTYSGTDIAGGGGGGGARGGIGGISDGDDQDGTAGGDGDGSGAGGDGGSSFGGGDGESGFDGGASVAAELSNTATTTGGGNAGSGSVTIETAPPAPEPSIDTVDRTSIALSWADVAEEDEYSVEFREQGASTWTTFSTLPAGSTSETVTGLTEGTAYEVRAVASNSIGDSASDALSATTDAPAPTLDSVTVNAGGDTFDVAWTRNGSDETAYRVLRSFDGEAFSQDNGDLAGTATSHTTTELLDGEEYMVKVRAVYNDATADSGTLSETTELPDVTLPPLDASVEDQLTADWSDAIDNGNYRIQIRETGESAWDATAVGFEEAVLGHDDTSHTFAGLKDGEQYDVRLRTETEHVTGTYDLRAPITFLPAPTELTIANRETTIGLTWTDNADNEDGTRLERSIDDGQSWTVVDDVGANVTVATDEEPHHYERADYRVVTYTEHAVASSGTVETVAVHPGAWYLELSRGDAEPVIPPQNLAGGSLDGEHSTVSGLTVEVAPSDPVWETLVRAEIALYYGTAQFFEGEILNVRQRDGVQELTCEGKLLDLEASTTTISYQNIRLDEAIEDYWGQTPATATVHEAFQNAVRAGEQFYDAPTSTGFTEFVDPDLTDPIHVTPTKVELAQTSFTTDAENADTVIAPTIATADSPYDLSGGDAVELSSAGDYVELDFELEHTIPGDEFAAYIREYPDDFSGVIRYSLDGDTIYELDTAGPSNTDIDWRDRVNLSLPGTVNEVPDLGPGTHTLRAEVLNGDNAVSGAAVVDVMAPQDLGTRFGGFSYTYDNNPDMASNAELVGPGYYPDGASVTITADENWYVPEITINATLDDVSGAQELAATTDGSTYLTATNTETATFDFDGADIVGTTVDVRVTLDRYSAVGRVTTPTQNTETQTLSAFELLVDTSDLPIVDEALELEGDTHLENIQSLHGEGPMRFVVDHQAEGLVVESFRKGDPSLAKAAAWTAEDGSVEKERTTEGYYNRIYAQGDGIDVEVVHTGEQAAFGTAVPGSQQFDTGDGGELAYLARQALIEAVANDELSGSFEIAPKVIQPGWPYHVPEFETNGGEGDAPIANLEQVRFPLASGTGQLEFGRRRGLVAQIQQRTRD